MPRKEPETSGKTRFLPRRTDPERRRLKERDRRLGCSAARLGGGTREEKQRKGKTARKLGDTGGLREVSKEVAAAEI